MMNPMINRYIQEQAHASAMLIGEHSVLAGYDCVVACLPDCVEVRLTENRCGTLTIHSSLGRSEQAMTAIQIEPPLDFVQQTVQQFIKQYAANLPADMGLSLDIHSTIDTQQGLGSSAAVTAAVAKSLFRWQNLPIHDARGQHQLLVFCRALIQRLQGQGSGADVAAAISTQNLYLQHF